MFSKKRRRNCIYHSDYGNAGADAASIQEQQKKGDGAEMKETPGNSVIWVSVAGGYSEDVVEAARSAGARGGTVIERRQTSQEQMTQFFGISVQEEQEFVMIVVPTKRRRRSCLPSTRPAA